MPTDDVSRLKWMSSKQLFANCTWLSASYCINVESLSDQIEKLAMPVRHLKWNLFAESQPHDRLETVGLAYIKLGPIKWGVYSFQTRSNSCRSDDDG